MEVLEGIAIGLGIVALVWAFVYIMTGVLKVWIYSEEIEHAFRRNPEPFKPNQLWIVKTLMALAWLKVKWYEEVFYYDTGLPPWRRNSQSN